ncbi:prolyl oligopeptidase family serine peptidase [Abyssalbus ytuae]|uniref:Prolyl oligopeptidase family serine peptidase n=1 Tax=Abyssalbus ytuae TaxID=2926907 RepID=A0A9E7CU14_9FLAO|nr:prolyl oligopeptidase family serine peptidase [Abyssalbus ytuae]UOB19196.1 prolyl oligopeptidase family serine peptidase [Abyssalbus ytuae]
MKNLLFIFFVLAVLSCNTKSEENRTPLPEQLLRIPYTSTIDKAEREYFLYLPKNYNKESEKKWPVLMFLHGDGERGNGKDELDYVMIHGPLYEAWVQKRDLPFIMIVPQMHMFGRDTIGLDYITNRKRELIPVRLEGDSVPPRPEIFKMKQQMTPVAAVDFDSIPYTESRDGWNKSEKDLLEMLNYVKENYSTDTNRYYLSGLSYGGFGTWYMASKHPDIFAAINPIVGWGHPDLMKPVAEAKIPVWAFAGGRDQVVQTRFFYESINKLEELGHPDVRFTVHEDMGHDTWRRIYAGQDIYDWFLEHSK